MHQTTLEHLMDNNELHVDPSYISYGTKRNDQDGIRVTFSHIVNPVVHVYYRDIYHANGIYNLRISVVTLVYMELLAQNVSVLSIDHVTNSVPDAITTIGSTTRHGGRVILLASQDNEASNPWVVDYSLHHAIHSALSGSCHCTMNDSFNHTYYNSQHCYKEID